MRLLALKRKVDSAERRVEACTNDLQKAEVRAKADKDRKEAKRKVRCHYNQGPMTSVMQGACLNAAFLYIT